MSLGLGSLPGGGQQLFPSIILRTVLMHQKEASEWLREKRDEEKRRESFGYWSMFVLTAIAAIGACVAAYPIIKG
jgi:ABC-type phosphate transport system permease subunit